eukprot:scaffold119186_cov34-Prasinocladus_malaysianus.AAC.1
MMIRLFPYGQTSLTILVLFMLTSVSADLRGLFRLDVTDRLFLRVCCAGGAPIISAVLALSSKLKLRAFLVLITALVIVIVPIAAEALRALPRAAQVVVVSIYQLVDHAPDAEAGRRERHRLGRGAWQPET